MSSVLIQILNGLSTASTLFLVAAGLSLIFGVTRIVNFAHGSLYMIGIYVAYSAIDHFGATPLGFWGGVLAGAVAAGIAGALAEMLVLRRVYRAPELFQLLATFGLVLLVKDLALWAWGPEDLLGPRAPGLEGAVEILGTRFPEYDLLLIGIGPTILGVLWLALRRTRWGTLIRAATQDREMVGALGVNQRWLFTGVFALGAALAGLAGALQIPREPAQLGLDLAVIVEAFVVVVVGGMGSIPGAFLAALVIGLVKAFCIGIGTVEVGGIEVSLSRLTLAVEFIVMAIVLIVRPWGLLGTAPALSHATFTRDAGSPPWSGRSAALTLFGAAALLAFVPLVAGPYAVVLGIDMLVFALFAASLYFLMGPAGMTSFGHAAYFGLGAYAAGLLFLRAGLPMELALAAAPVAALAGAALFGWFCVRLSGVYLAMLTLAFAQIVWSVVFQWDDFTGGSNGLVGIWPAEWLRSREAYYLLVLGVSALCIFAIQRTVRSPFGLALRGTRDSALRAEAIGIDVRRFQWAAFALAGLLAGVAGALHAFSKGSISPEVMAVGRSVDALVMVLLGGVHTLLGPVVGAGLFTWLQDTVARSTDYWRAILGMLILAIVIVFPGGLVGGLTRLARRTSLPG